MNTIIMKPTHYFHSNNSVASEFNGLFLTILNRKNAHIVGDKTHTVVVHADATEVAFRVTKEARRLNATTNEKLEQLLYGPNMILLTYANNGHYPFLDEDAIIMEVNLDDTVPIQAGRVAQTFLHMPLEHLNRDIDTPFIAHHCTCLFEGDKRILGPDNCPVHGNYNSASIVSSIAHGYFITPDILSQVSEDDRFDPDSDINGALIFGFVYMHNIGQECLLLSMYNRLLADHVFYVVPQNHFRAEHWAQLKEDFPTFQSYTR